MAPTQVNQRQSLLNRPRLNSSTSEGEISDGGSSIHKTSYKRLSSPLEAGNHSAIPSQLPFAPKFLSRTALHEGVVKLRCYDEKTLTWLKGIVPTFKAPREGFNLTLIKQRQLRPNVKAALYVPDYQGDTDFLHKILMIRTVGNIQLAPGR
ncbi:unnamed protein product, partial [Brenthis ino]